MYKKIQSYKSSLLQSKIDRETRREEEKVQRKLKKREDAKKQKEEYKVGAIFVNSWGYDQTQVDAYQIIEVSGSKITFKPIATEHIEETSWASANVKPVPNAFHTN